MSKKLHYTDAVSEKEKKAFTSYLAEDEELILAAGFSKMYVRSKFMTAILLPGGVWLILGLAGSYLLNINLGIGLLIGLILASFTAFLRTFHHYHANRYLLTTRRVIIKKGIFAVKLTSALYDKITHIEVDQSFMDKFLYHHGTIIINTAGLNKGEIVLSYVEYPIELKNLLERLINRERERYGMYSGGVVSLEGEVVE